ncbi:late secretory pathway protein avl9 [Toensbergia leucococca]|nr:late secretory pathway protein avl9 [Toensbergia leucococca]
MAFVSTFAPLVCIVAFHHARGPEIESWFGVEGGSDPAVDNDWSFLPFMALSDGSHASTEDFSYFTLRQRRTDVHPTSSVFGISCTRQMDAGELLYRPADVTRSTVQKAVVVVADNPQYFGQLREKLSIVTRAWFAQRDFSDVDILKKFQESLAKSLQDTEDDRDQYLGKYPKRARVEVNIHLPSQAFHYENSYTNPELDSYEKNLVMPTSLKTSERSSLLSYMGLPLQLFGKGSLLGPYTPLQQLDILADYGTKSYIVGSTNSLLLQQKDRYSDILINLDESSISITSPSLRNALTLSPADRRWIDFLTVTVSDTWDERNPSQPKSYGYLGSEEFIRLQFEEYLLALLSSVKYNLYLNSHPSPIPLPNIEGDPSIDFNPDWVQAWRQTSSFALFASHTDSHLFDIVEPRHPTAGTLSLDDIQRRVSLQIQSLHLDERFASSKDLLGKHLATGQKKVTSVFNTVWADIEDFQRRRGEEQKSIAAQTADSTASSPPPTRFPRPPDLSLAQASVTAAGHKAGAYISSWGTWASERRKGWGRNENDPVAVVTGKVGDGAGMWKVREGEEGVGRSRDWGKVVEGERERKSPAGKDLSRGRREERGGDGIGRLDA